MRGIRMRHAATPLRVRRPGDTDHCDQQQKDAAGDVETAPQRALARANSTNMPTGTPVGPFGIATRSVSENAVPAMSRWTHGTPSANSSRNLAAVIEPAARPPVFFRSATSDLINSL